MITSALSNMCAAVFPSFSQAQLVSGALSSSVYARAFAPACKQFKNVLSLKPPNTYYLVLGFPIGNINFLAGASVCFAMRPGCGDDGETRTCSNNCFVLFPIPVVVPVNL